MDIALVEKFKDLWDKKRHLKAELEETQKLLDQWEEILIEKFTEEGIQNMKTGLGTFYLREDFYCSYDHAREGEAFSWLREEGEGALIKETINSKTLAAWAREKKDQEIELPSFFNITIKPKIGVRGGK